MRYILMPQMQNYCCVEYKLARNSLWITFKLVSLYYQQQHTSTRLPRVFEPFMPKETPSDRLPLPQCMDRAASYVSPQPIFCFCWSVTGFTGLHLPSLGLGLKNKGVVTGSGRYSARRDARKKITSSWTAILTACPSNCLPTGKWYSVW